MEYLLLIVIAVIASLLDDKIRGKKKVPPPTLPHEIPKPTTKVERREEGARFEIPPMRNVPQEVQPAIDTGVLRAQEEMRAAWEEARREEERQRRRHREEEQRRAAAEKAAAAVFARRRVPHRILPQITPAAMQQAVVMAEVLGKPLSLRRR
ncbi:MULTISPECIES: hypothetical protein [Selenomonas]|jgi:hypothetical protein|uniref:hypothetical protein n=1 Tax=Selenomonas TaxID=970 RepID=UPI00027A3D6B|nr:MULTISPECIES: hypothetical protein [Selenomonas]EJP33171.1 hypothetical protein HMPREF1147_1806 [Selenomonas sp. FOBRC9]